MDVRRVVSIRQIDMAIEDMLSPTPAVATATVTKGREWSDCLNSFSSSDPLVVSEAVASVIRDARFSAVQLREIRFEVKGQIPRPPCRYFALLPGGKPLKYLARFYKKAMGFQPLELICEQVDDGRSSPTPPGESHKQRIPIFESWDGSDLLQWWPFIPIGGMGMVICSRRFVKMVFANKWANFGARPIDSIDPFAYKPLDECAWPPESWYPQCQPREDEWKEEWIQGTPDDFWPNEASEEERESTGGAGQQPEGTGAREAILVASEGESRERNRKPGEPQDLPANRFDPAVILQVLDECCRKSNFPVLDDDYRYLAANRLSLHRSGDDWALVIEIFGYSPRSGLGLEVYTFGSRLHNRNGPEAYGTAEGHQAYLDYNPHNESRCFYLVEEGSWEDDEDPGAVAPWGTVVLRETPVKLPSVAQYRAAGIELWYDQPWIFELYRYLAFHFREQVLATNVERRVSVPPELTEILVLEDWHHPDVAEDELPSQTETFRELARVLASGDISQYRAADPHNTHWRNWPAGGQL